jgi:uncharacterized protein (TIGR02001 family)
VVSALGTAGIALMALAGQASAEDRQFSWSVTGGGYSDYMFRGYSNNDNDPYVFASFDIGYGIFYAGVYTGMTDAAYNLSSWEIDTYAGIKPVTGPVTWDFGVIYYAYPNKSVSSSVTSDFVELKAAASITPVQNLTTSIAAYYSPDYSFEVGNSLAVEGTVGYTLPKVWIFTPTIGGTVGNMQTEDPGFGDADGNVTVDDYWYWNAGVSLAVEKFTFDLRYWDTDIDNRLSDERFVAGFKITLP